MEKLRKIVITGPESSGKTTLAQRLAAHFGALWVPEYARQYLEQINRPYRREDLLQILEGQLRLEAGLGEQSQGLLFCDTGPEVIRIWSQVKFGKVDKRILELGLQQSYDLYLLCRPDLPWQEDPLREAPEVGERDVLFSFYQRELRKGSTPWQEISGQGEERTRQAISAVEDLLARKDGD